MTVRPRRPPRRGRIAALVVATACAASIALAGPAAAEELTSAQASERAQAAASGDEAALDDLREVTAIDGRPVDLDSILDGDERERAARLTDLAGALDEESEAGSTGSSGQTTLEAGTEADRRRAQEVLGQDEYREPDLPRPFRRPLQWLGDRLVAAWDFAVGVLSPVLGTRGAALVLAAGIGGALALLLVRLVQRSAKRSPGAGAPEHGTLLVDPSLDPADLERQADRAREAGDHAAAVRLRYDAGLVRLVRSGRLRLRAATTPAGAAEQIGMPAMDALTATFEEIVYGGRPASASDVDDAVAGWRVVLGAGDRV